MLQFSQLTNLVQADHLRLREVPEWGCLLVYTPSNPGLHYLDIYGWFVVRLCQQPIDYLELKEEFIGSLPAETCAADGESTLNSVLEKLLAMHILQEVGRSAKYE